jgi:hypothetical protein
LLQSSGADVTVPVAKGEHVGKTPYAIASHAGKDAIHVFLFEQIAMGNVETLSRLFAAGVPINITDGFAGDDSTLHWAVSFGHVDVVKFLLSNGFDVNMVNNHKQSALHIACKNNYVSIAEIMILEGCDVHGVDVAGYTPFKLCPVPVLPAMDNLFKHVPAPTYQYRDAYTRSQSQLATSAETVSSTISRSLSSSRDGAEHSNGIVVDIPHGDGYVDITAGNIGTGNSGELDSEDIYDLMESATVQSTESSQMQMLVLWPPVQRQTMYAHSQEPLVLNSSSPVLISVASTDIEIYPLLTASGLLDALDSCGVQSQVKRSCTSASIRLAIDNKIVPGVNRFEIKVTPTAALITASDACGLLYAVSTFVQILTLHSTIGYCTQSSLATSATTAAQATGTSGSSLIATVSIPSIVIQDWPDFVQRAVSLTFRSNAQLSLDVFTEHIQLFSRIRLNTIILTIDTSADSSGMSSEGAADGEGNVSSEVSNSTTIHAERFVVYLCALLSQTSTTMIYALDEACKRHAIDLIPSMVLTSTLQHDHVAVDLIKNFSYPMIFVSVVFNPYDVEKELGCVCTDDCSSRKELVETSCREACSRFFASIQQCCRHSSVSISCNAWTAKTVEPLVICFRLCLLNLICADQPVCSTLFD